MGQVKFPYAPGLIGIYMQLAGHTRFIRMNQEQGKTSPKYYGNSVGRWEGDTQVVETNDDRRYGQPWSSSHRTDSFAKVG